MGPTLRVEIFPSDLRAAIRFYNLVLGFQLTRHEPHMVTRTYLNGSTNEIDLGYAYLVDGQIYIGADSSYPAGSLAVRSEYRRPPTAVELVIEVDDLDLALKKVNEHQWPVRKGEDIKMQIWGLRDFRIEDPDEYFIRISEKSTYTDGTGFESAA